MKKDTVYLYKQVLNYFCIIVLTIPFLSSCKKFLDTKPDKSLATPTSVRDLQGLLDYFPFINNQCSNACEVASDNYYLTEKNFLALPQDRMRAAYLWKDGMFKNALDWQHEYTVVYNANVVLDNLSKIPKTSDTKRAWNSCKGGALFFRAKSFFEIAQIWTKAYDSTTAKSDLGIPLRLTPDFNAQSKRASVKETYNRIITDAKASIPLLPDLPDGPFRPSKCAAFGLLARTYLVMHDYDNAGIYADSCLNLNDNLVNYNTIDTESRYPFFAIQYKNPEIIILSTARGALNINSRYARVDSILFNLYGANDLRKDIFFADNPDSSHYFKGSYVPEFGNFNGISTDEILLIKAECLARKNKITSAMRVLNGLLITRWKDDTFVPYQAENKEKALNLILTERRKELVYRMLRFSDIKRLNREGANIVLKRVIQGKTYVLNPNDPRYALPIPQSVILHGGIAQN